MSAILVTLFRYGTPSAPPVDLGSLTEPREHGVMGLGGDESRSVQVDPTFRAEQVTIHDRGNRQERLSLNVVRLHSTIGDAMRWWLLHPRSCPIKVDVRFQQGTGEEWLLGAGISSVRRVDRPGGGLTTIFGYELVGGQWASSPSTPYTDPLLA